TISSNFDRFQFAYRAMAGSGTIVARLLTLSAGNSAVAGVMVRSGMQPGAPHASMLLKTDGAAELRRRTSISGDTSYTAGSAPGVPGCLKLVRQWNASAGTSTLTGYV